LEYIFICHTARNMEIFIVVKKYLSAPVTLYQSARYNIKQDFNTCIQQHRRENLKYRTLYLHSETKFLIMVERIVGLYSKNRMKHITALCGKYVAIFNGKASVPSKGRVRGKCHH
jgi:hypothetical protein